MTPLEREGLEVVRVDPIDVDPSTLSMNNLSEVHEATGDATEANPSQKHGHSPECHGVCF